MIKRIKLDVRLSEDSVEKIRAIAARDKATLQDTIRKLCDIGISLSLATDGVPQPPLSPLDEEILSTLKSLSVMVNLITTNTVDLKKTTYTSIDELGQSIKKMAAESVRKFKEKVAV